jgi:hypothetical protein
MGTYFTHIFEWSEPLGFGETWERDWREHEENFSKKISVLSKPKGERHD